MAETIAPPITLEDLPAWLEDHRFGEITDQFGNQEIVRFLHADQDGLWFSGEKRPHFLRTRAPAGSRVATARIVPGGVEVQAWGGTIRLRYLTGGGR